MQKNPYLLTTFVKSAPGAKDMPADSGFEVAFAGRSNAGKSSCLNALTGQKNLAKTSKTPGRTQLLNVFTIGDDGKRLIDLPGYGYAKVPIEVKEKWQERLDNYLKVRKCLQGLILLMDCRHPLTALDETFINLATDRELPLHILLTKSDKLSKSQAHAVLHKVQKAFDLTYITVQNFSATTKQGLPELIAKLNLWLGFKQTDDSGEV